jgi:hypothetical protein
MSKTTESEKLDISTFPELQGWREKQLAIVKENPFVEITDNKSFEQAKKARTALVSARTNIKEQDKLIASKLKDIRNRVSATTTELINITLPHEKKQQEEVTRFEDQKEAERLAKENAERERKEAIEKKIEAFYQASKAIIETMTFDKIDHFKSNFKEGLDKTDLAQFEEFEIQFATKVKLLFQQFDDKTQVLTEKENQRIEAEKLKKEKEEFEAQKRAKEEADKKEREQREAEQRAIDAENQRKSDELYRQGKVIEAENKRKQEEIEAAQSKLDADKKALADAEAKKIADHEAAEKAKAKQIQREKEEKEKAETEAAEAKRIEELKPDKEKAFAYIESLDFTLNFPDIKEENIRIALVKVKHELNTTIATFKNEILKIK